MNADERFLLALAGDVSDGKAVDWPSVTATPEAEGNRAVIEEMALLARIGDLHRIDRPSTDDVLTQWKDLRVLERVGVGMAGEVYRAYDDRLQREVALKLYFPDPDSAAHGVYVVQPDVAMAWLEKDFLKTATRWRFADS